MKEIKGFEDLVVFQKAYGISLEMHTLTLKFPTILQRDLGDQIRRSSKGICANIAEGYGKQRVSKAEFRRFLLMAMGSADEMRVWLRYALDFGYLDEAAWRQYRACYQDIAKMLNGLHKSWE